MSEHLPNSYLVGIHLTISTHSGPQVVYSYPPARVGAIHSRKSSSDVLSRRKTLNRNGSASKKGSKLQSQLSEASRDVDTSIRSRTSMKSVKSEASSISSASSRSSNSGLSSSDGLSESELSTDYADESFTSESDTGSTTSSSDSENETDNAKINSASKNGISIENDNTLRNRLSGEGEDEHLRGFTLNDEFFLDEIFQDTNKVFGFDSEFVAEFCCPDRELCNTKFEFTIDQLAFLGLPIHCDSKGKWRKSKHKRQFSRKLTNSTSHGNLSRKGHSVGSRRSKNENDLERRMTRVDTLEPDDEMISSHIGKDNLDKNMNMFHVCFVMNPPLTEYNKRIDDMYQYVVAKLSLLLRYVQSKSNYVSEECEIILKETESVKKNSQFYQSIKSPGERGKYLYQRILSKSSLARCLTKCVDQLHKNEIACVELGNDKVISLQIPVNNEFQDIPNYKIHPILPNSYLSTVLNNNFLEGCSYNDTQYLNAEGRKGFLGATDNIGNDNDILNYSLLLLDEPTQILETLESSTQTVKTGDLNTLILRQLVKQIKPTTPLISYHDIITSTLQLESSEITYDILRSCAIHLIYWRYARVIIPLSSKHIYIVSPLLSLDLCYSGDEKKFREKFSSLPSLAYFLSRLSGSTSMENAQNGGTHPRQFGALIPSKEHKGAYLNALSWLVRHGYVCQLLTFALIRIDRKIKIAVEEDLEKEGYNRRKKEIAKRRRHRSIGNSDQDNNPLKKSGLRDQTSGIDNVMKNLQTDDDRKQFQTEEAADSKDPYESDHFEFDDPEFQNDYTIILEPERATALEKRWIYKCIHNQPHEIQILFNKLLKFFNGKSPLEVIMLNKGVSRHEMKKLFVALDRYLIKIHHW
ncbi:Npr3p KNAG_0J02810 [Huiozyma naganishii CBS 8797]|uniref:Nitrogen permease regulator 3 n=1 Tax=Huiozyma naganishii (strain ATCC MYA-139 / BCRC 22969 / CBS 8797 / KCTC 17520 / NBRC 10181 / NCYC 3082 / Yp74L-3) TaxID=1071383 RepID=J7RBT2_HUIN7|nr:hypothetical protein KNAG_0J02810 [Kazachstania naganishii CBS 8797]CCK72360.1 hypothetical protein KNAG_0J02810 [Kazachstania naganishii CBS 8797]